MAKQFCPECGVRFEPQHPLALFCSPAHKRLWNNRNNIQGSPLVLPLKVWRKARHLKGDPIGAYALVEICFALDKLIAEDKAAGRPDPVDLMKARLRRQGISLKYAAPKKAQKKKGAA